MFVVYYRFLNQLVIVGKCEVVIRHSEKETIKFPDYIQENDFPQVVDYFRDDAVRPYIVVCPGGGYEVLSYAHEGTEIVKWLNDAGFHAGIYLYPLAPKIDPETFITAEQELLTDLDSDDRISRVFVLGFSAGAHAAGLFGMTPSQKLAGIVLCYPVVSLTEPFRHEGSANNFLKNAFKPNAATVYSLENVIHSNYPRTFIWHTVTDDAVPYDNSLRLAQALKSHKVPFELHLFEEGHHGLGLAKTTPTACQWPVLVESWLYS